MRPDPKGGIGALRIASTVSAVPKSRAASRDMPITSFLGAQKFDRETKRIMGVALEMARKAAKREWAGLYVSRIIAKRIIEIAKDGERDPDVMCAQALSYLREALE